MCASGHISSCSVLPPNELAAATTRTLRAGASRSRCATSSAVTACCEPGAARPGPTAAGSLLLLLVLPLPLLAVAAGPPPVHTVADVSQVFNVARPSRNTTTILYLGSFDAAPACAAACAALAPQRCWSFTHHGAAFPGGLALQCFGLTSPRWTPVPVAPALGTTSGWLEWPCRDDFDCSLNGACSAAGVCACNRAWRGPRCEALALEPATKGAGYEPVDNGEATTTWGGNAVPCGGSRTGMSCMFVSEITRHCGIAAWAQNSRVVMAVSASPGGAYSRTNVTWPVFSHEPAATLAPSGEIVLYLTASNPPRAPTCACVNGSTDPGDCGAAAADAAAQRLGDSDPTLMTWAPSADGPWSTPEQLFVGYKGADLNFSPIIFKNGSVLAMWRKWTGLGSRVFLATAPDWRNASSYVMHEQQELFQDLSEAGTEDMFIYQAPDGTFHSIFHHMVGINTTSTWWLVAAGAHAFSRDGVTWEYGGLAWGNSTAQGYNARFTDGTTFHYTRLERPAFVFDEADGLPSFLMNAAQYGTGRSASGSSGGDAAYTLIQPIAGAS